MRYTLDQLDALSNAATPAPWSLIPVTEKPEGYCVLEYPEGIDNGPETFEDAEFIAAARSAVPELISRIRVLEAQLENMLESHENLYKSTFGEDSDPNNDIVRLMALNALGVKS